MKLVIFDMDGLMLDTERLCLRVWPEVFTMLPQAQCTQDCYDVCGRNFTGAVELLQHRHPGLDIEDLMHGVEDKVNAVIEAEGVALKEGLLSLLDALEEKGVPKVVATSTARERASRRLEQAGILHRFDGLVCGDMVTYSKPDPEIFLLAAQMAGVPPEQCMVLEDSFAGITAAHRAGMKPVMIPDMVQPDEEILALAYHRCDSLSDVISLLQ